MKTKVQKANEPTFEERYKSFKEGTGSAPTLHKDATIKFAINEGKKEVWLSVEEMDSDGEIVEMAGGKVRNRQNGIPMIDSHKAFSGVVENGLGAVRNPKFIERNGKRMLVGEPDFAPTPAGEIAKILYMGVNGGKPYFTDVSMGFMVYDYDNETKTIKEWEVFELSLVTAGANRSARFVDKALDGEIEAGEVTDEDVQIAKDLARFKQIHEPFKEFSKLFLSDSFCKTIGYEKDGDMLIDINSIYDTILAKVTAKTQEAPKIAEEAPKLQEKQATQEQIESALLQAFSKYI